MKSNGRGAENGELSSLGNLIFTIPTYRFLGLGETVKRYSVNFDYFNHDLPLVVFDDGPVRSDEDLDYVFRGAENSGGIYYVGREEKDIFLERIIKKSGLDSSLVRKMFRPSYGGNRNFTLVYTLGNFFISSDDDMHPEGLFEDNQGLGENEVLRGRYIDREGVKYQVVSQDVVSAFLEVLGRRPSDLNGFLYGEYVQDSAMDLFTNTTKGDLGENVLSLVSKIPNKDSVIKLAQTYRTGSSDVDAKDYAEEFLKDPELVLRNDMSRIYVISDFAPCVTGVNWRVDCGVSGYDNRTGLPPFIPTKLRFEDYVFRLWSQKEGVASAHVNAVQTHRRNPYNRLSLPRDYHNEELANYLKVKLFELTKEIRDTSILFDGGLEFEKDDFGQMILRAERLRSRALEMSRTSPHNKSYFIPFANDFYTTYEEFDFDDFFKLTTKHLKKEYDLLKSTMEVWPTILEASLEVEKPARRIK